jgi:chromosome segregation protein
MNQCRLRLTKCRERREQLAMEVNLLDAQRSTISEGTSRLELQFDRLASRLQELKKGDDEDLYKKYQNDLERMLAERLSAEKQLKTVRKMFEDLEYQKHGQEKERNIIDSEIALNSSELESHRLALRELTTRRDALEEQFANQEADLPELLGTLGDNYDLNAKEVELQLIQDRIQRLGPINLAAIQEYELESERREYLDKQNEELEEALETLKTAIKKIDRETRSRFKDTFDLLNNNIRDLFPKLFGGGEAYLEIIDDDLLNTGVMIRARPPGKKNASIHMLSGGEKALTAIAMVFAIFKLNPAPFCMLDEVDAPLDDLNVARYAEVVRDMSDQVQFIIVTHNKTTMQATNQLVGVTMMEAGVSKIVSVDVNAAVKLSAST